MHQSNTSSFQNATIREMGSVWATQADLDKFQELPLTYPETPNLHFCTVK